MSTTVCMTDTSIIPFPTLDTTYTQTSNTAASPLPHVPCRNPRTGPLLSLSNDSLPLSDVSKSPNAYQDVDYQLQSRYATFMRFDSGSSSSSSTPSDEIQPTIIPRSKRVTSRGSTTINSSDSFTPATPAPTPIKPRADARLLADIDSRKQTPLRDISDEEDTPRPFHGLGQAPHFKVGKLRLEGLAGKHGRHSSDSTIATSRVSDAGTTDGASQPHSSRETQTLRKKSGQPIKSSLKSARRPNLHVVTDGSFAKSEPATPTHAKAVHFDSKLEHVKLFLAEQKPLAVSRDGSPTTDSGTEDFPSFIYGDGSRETREVKMLLPNMPLSPRREHTISLQELKLSQDQRTINGKIRVRNIAYEKWLAVRFTLDWWQTTSEVTARYEESVEGGTFDVFSFSIRLHDIWSRIEEKTIFIALRYTVAGQEYWDNNAGQNYHIKFVLDTAEPTSAVDNDRSLRDLNSRLEEVAKSRSVPVPGTPYRLGRSFSADYQPPLLGKSLSSRYDFASAYKTHWVRPATPPSNRHTRTHTYPSSVPATAAPTVAPWSNTHDPPAITQPTSSPRPPPSPLGCPREVVYKPPSPPAHSEEKPTLSESTSATRLQESRERNHRRGYADRIMEGSPTMRRTPTGSPLKFDLTSNGAAAQIPRTRSYPLTESEKSVPMGSSPQFGAKPPLSIQIAPAGDGGSQESTPSDATQSSSSSASSCTPLMSPGSDGGPRNETTYKQLIDQFCFYTGADSLLQDSSEILLRSRSVSNLGDYMLSHSPPQSFSSHLRDLARFSSFENGGHSNGSVTPTAVGS